MFTDYNKNQAEYSIPNSVNYNLRLVSLNKTPSSTVFLLSPNKNLENSFYVTSAGEKISTFSIKHKDLNYNIPRLANRDGTLIDTTSYLNQTTFPILFNSSVDSSSWKNELFKNIESLFGKVESHNDSSKILINLTNIWTKSVKESKSNIQGLKLNISLKNEKIFEEREVLVKLDEGIEEEGKIIYGSFIRDGKKYNLQAVEVSSGNKLYQTSNTIGYSDDKKSLSITTITPIDGPKPITKNYKFKFDSKTDTICLGENRYTLGVTKSYNFVKHCLITISNDKNTTIWHYDDLLDDYEAEEKTKNGYLKRCKNNLDYFKSSLGDGFNDLFKIGNKYIQINSKYR